MSIYSVILLLFARGRLSFETITAGGYILLPAGQKACDNSF